MRVNQLRLDRWATRILALPILLFSAGAASGQPSSEPSVAVGSRIRLVATALDGRRVQGTVTDLGPATLTVMTDSQQRVVVPRNGIGRLDVSTGQHRQTGRGILIGAAAGAGLSVVLPKCVNEGCASGVGFDPTFAVVYALGGAMWGGLIGTVVKTETWASVPVDTVRIGVVPTRGRGIGVVVSVGLRRSAGRHTRG